MAGTQNPQSLLSTIMAVERMRQSAAEQEANRQARLQAQEVTADQRRQYENEQQAIAQQKLQEEAHQRAQEAYLRAQGVYSQRRGEWERELKGLQEAPAKKYQEDLARLNALRGTVKTGIVNPEKLLRYKQELEAADKFLQTTGKDWTSANLSDSMAPYVKQYKYLGNPAVQSYAQQLVADRAGRDKLYESAQAGLPQYADEGQAQLRAIQENLLNLKPGAPDPTETARLEKLLHGDPQQTIQEILGPLGGVAEASQQQAPSPLADLQAIIQHDTEKKVGPIPESMAPFVAGTISGHGGGRPDDVNVVTTAGHGRDVVAQAFDKFNAHPGASMAAQGERVPPGPPPFTQPPVDVGLIMRAPTFGAFLHEQTPSTSSAGPMGAGPGLGDVQHMVAAHAMWNGPRSEELGHYIKNTDPQTVHDVLASHALRTGVPLEHIVKAGIDSGHLGSGDGQT